MPSKYPDLVSSLIALSGQEGLVVLHRAFVQFTGSLPTALMLNQLLYWTPRAKNGWIAKSDKEFAGELCLSKYGVRKARERLEVMGLLSTEVRGFSGAPTVHYHLVLERLQTEWILWIRKMVVTSNHLHFSKSQEGSFEIARSNTEITTETTNKTEELELRSSRQAPVTFSGWAEKLRSVENKKEQIAVLHSMYCILYPDNEPPAYPRLGTTAKRLGVMRTAQLLWETATRPPVGSVLDFIEAVAKGKRPEEEREVIRI